MKNVVSYFLFLFFFMFLRLEHNCIVHLLLALTETGLARLALYVSDTTGKEGIATGLVENLTTSNCRHRTTMVRT